MTAIDRVATVDRLACYVLQALSLPVQQRGDDELMLGQRVICMVQIWGVCSDPCSKDETLTQCYLMMGLRLRRWPIIKQHWVNFFLAMGKSHYQDMPSKHETATQYWSNVAASGPALIEYWVKFFLLAGWPEVSETKWLSPFHPNSAVS